MELAQTGIDCCEQVLEHSRTRRTDLSSLATECTQNCQHDVQVARGSDAVNGSSVKVESLKTDRCIAHAASVTVPQMGSDADCLRYYVGLQLGFLVMHVIHTRSKALSGVSAVIACVGQILTRTVFADSCACSDRRQTIRRTVAVLPKVSRLECGKTLTLRSARRATGADRQGAAATADLNELASHIQQKRLAVSWLQPCARTLCQFC